MKDTSTQKLSNRNSILIWVLVFVSIIFISNISVFATIMWYWSDSDYNSPVNSFSGSANTLSGETLTWATQVDLTQAVQLVNGWINIIIPNTTRITSANWSSFNVYDIWTSLLTTLPIALATNEEEVWKIILWINWFKLNFSKPVRISIPVNTTKSTVRIKVKHAWIDWYQTYSLTDNIWSSCTNWIASPSSNIATVVGWIATIYTCSASEFVAIVDKVITTTSSSSSGGWWSTLRRDNCPSWDFSPSYYDNKCWNTPLVMNDKILNTWSSISDYSNNSINWVISQLKTVNYNWINIVVYEWYRLSQNSNEISKKVIEHSKLTIEQKKSYINRQNEFMMAKYNLDIAQEDERIKKNKYNKQFVLLIWATEKLKKDFN